MLIRKEVERVLREKIQARSDDRFLMLEVWKQKGFELTPEQTSRFWGLPSPESIRRTRQKLQEEGKYPANPEIQAERQNLAKETSNEMVADRIFDDRAMRNMRRMF